MTTISSQRLDDAIAASKATLDRWASEQKAIADRLAAEAAEQYAEFEKRMEASREKLLALKLKRGLNLSDDSKNLEKVQSEIQVTMDENEELEAILVEKKQAIDYLIEDREKRQAAVAQQKQEKEMTEIQSKATLEDLTRGLMCYKKLGLDMEKPDDERICLHFSQIDPNDPDKIFTIEISLGDVWIVTNCTLLPSETQKEVIAPLNEKNDIALFVRTVRKAFVDHLQSL